MAKSFVPSSLLLALVCSSAPSCKRLGDDDENVFADLGVGDGAARERPLGVHAPIPRGDLAQIGELGRSTWDAMRALELAHAAVVERMGATDGDVILPIVDIDPGGKSAQVVMLRWQGRTRGPLPVAEAQRWVMVSLLLAPDRVLDVELLAGEVEPGSVEFRRAEALVVAADALQHTARDASFFTVDRFVVEPTGEKRPRERTVGVIYAVAASGDGPDIEIVVGEKTRKRPAAVLRSFVVHPEGVPGRDPIEVGLDDPHPMSVARALQRGGEHVVRARSGEYLVAADGTVVRRKP